MDSLQALVGAAPTDPPPVIAAPTRVQSGRIAVIDFAPPKDTAAPGKRGEDGAHGVSAGDVRARHAYGFHT